MNYQKHYELLISRAKTRNISDEMYIEVHHIIPKCLSGTDEKENLVCLTAEEHFLAHLLLVKIYPKHKSLVFAAHRMTSGNKHQTKRNSNKLYGWLRRKYVEASKGRIFSEETRQKMSESLKGKTPWNKGKKCPQISESLKGRKSSIKGRPSPHRGSKRPNTSKALTGRISPLKGVHRKGLPVLCIELDRAFKSVADAARFCGLKCSNGIHDSIRGKSGKKSSGGYTWKYIEEN